MRRPDINGLILRCRIIPRPCIFAFFLIFIILFPTRASANYFDSVTQRKPQDRIATATRIFIEHIQPADSLTAYNELNKLLQWAKSNGDHRLTCTVLRFLAQYEDDLRQPRSDDRKIIGFYEEAKQIAIDHDLELDMARTYHALGTFYYYRKKYGVAFAHLSKADELFRKIGMARVEGIFRILMDLGLIYYDFDDHDNALRFLREATQYPAGKAWEEKMTLTAIGLVYRHRNEYDSARYFFDKTLQVAQRDGDSTWIGIASGNIGSVLLFTRQYDAAIPYLEADVRLCARAGEWSSCGGSMIRLAEISIIRKNYTRALAQLNYADTMISKTKDLNRFRDLYRQYAIIYEQLGSPDRALQYRKLYENVKDSLDQLYSDKVYSDAQIRIESERHQANIKLIQSEKRSAVFQRNSVMVFLALAMVILLLLLNRQRMRRKSAQDELANAARLMKTYTENIRQKNQLIDQFTSEIAALQDQLSAPLSTEKTEALEKLLSSVILTEDDWKTFRELFDKVHKGFTVRLRERLPDLTQAETRLVTLTRLGLSDREMAGMLGINIDTVRKTRQRLRKKLSSNEHGSFEELVASI